MQKNPIARAPKCVNCGRAQPDNFTDCRPQKTTSQLLTSTAIAHHEANHICPPVEASSLHSIQAAGVTTPTAHNMASNRIAASDYN